MNTFIVATVIANGNPAHPPQIDMIAVRTTNSAQAQSMVVSQIRGIEVMSVTARCLNDAAENVLKMQDGEMRTL